MNNVILSWQPTAQKTRQIDIKAMKGIRSDLPNTVNNFDVTMGCYLVGKDVKGKTKFPPFVSPWIYDDPRFQKYYLARCYFVEQGPFVDEVAFSEYEIAAGYCAATGLSATLLNYKLPSRYQLTIAKRAGFRIRLSGILAP